MAGWETSSEQRLLCVFFISMYFSVSFSFLLLISRKSPPPLSTPFHFHDVHYLWPTLVWEHYMEISIKKYCATPEHQDETPGHPVQDVRNHVWRIHHVYDAHQLTSLGFKDCLRTLALCSVEGRARYHVVTMSGLCHLPHCISFHGAQGHRTSPP